VGDLEFDVVDDAGQRVEETPVLADQDGVRQRGGFDVHGAADDVVEFDILARKLEAPMGLAALGFEIRALFGGEV
jgi:hypothetical protein